ncbi:MAG: hypothetical protein AAGG50_11295 [Bacteroidota bacterium]
MRVLFLLLLAGLLSLAPTPSQAQEALPDLTPREFEIQGDLQVDFSGIRRQPLSGFGPPPRAYVVPAERAPTERVYGFPLEQIEPPELPAQPIPKTDLLRPLTGTVEGLAGVYAARAARLRLQQSGATGAFFLDADYDGLSTYSPFDAAVSSGTAIYNRAGGTVGYESSAGWQIEAGGQFVDHELYGAAFAAPGALAGSALPDQPTRTTVHGHLLARFGDAESPASGTLRYDYASTATDLDAFATPATLAADDPTEGRLTASGHATWRRLHLDGHGSIAGADAAVGTDIVGAGAGLALALRQTRTSSLRLGARVLFTEGVLGTTTAVGPLVAFELRPRRGTVRVFAENSPRVVHQGLASVFAANPFAERAPLIMPEIRPVDARAGVRTQFGEIQATVYGGAQWGDHAQFFERNAQTGLFTVGYDEAQRFFGGVEAAFGSPDRIEATVGVEARSGRLVDADADLPYYAPVVATASVATALLNERLRLGLHARAEGVRPASVAGDEAPGFLDLSAEASYRFNERFDVVVRGGGLAGEVERWDGYPEAPFTMLGGLRARW